MSTGIYNAGNIQTVNKMNMANNSSSNQVFSSFEKPVNNSNNLKSDSVVLFGKEVKKKRLAIAVGGVSLAILSAIVYKKRADILKVFQDIKFKSMPTEKIEIPKGTGYDLSKESGTLYYNTYNTQFGYKDYFVNDNGVLGLDDEVNKILRKAHCQGNFQAGKTKDGFCFVRCQQMPAPNLGLLPRRLEGICLVSDSQDFTPAQKNLIALMHQNKLLSENSPFEKIADEVIGEKPSRKSVLDAIERWAQDIDIDNVETQKLLKNMSSLKNGKAVFNVAKFLENPYLADSRI